MFKRLIQLTVVLRMERLLYLQLPQPGVCSYGSCSGVCQSSPGDAPGSFCPHQPGDKERSVSLKYRITSLMIVIFVAP